MKKFLQKYGELPRNQFGLFHTEELFKKSFGKNVKVPLTGATGTKAVNQAVNKWDAERNLRVAFIDNGKKQTIALVGKGVVFDSGGMNIKTGGYMTGMKFDKMGALSVMAVGIELQKLKNPKHNYLIICPFADNMVSPAALCPDDVIEYDVGGKTLRVEIENTDAEGRLILADGILEAQARGANLIIDVATLTGAVSYVLGDGVTGVFGNDEDLKNELVRAFTDDGKHENAFILPLFQQHRDALKAENSRVADVVNSARGSKAGASTAAAFLEKFVYTDALWAHLDIAGVADHGGKATSIVAESLLKFITGLKG